MGVLDGDGVWDLGYGRSRKGIREGGRKGEREGQWEWRRGRERVLLLV